MRNILASKVFSKFLITFLLIVLIPVFVLGSLNYFKFSNLINDELYSYNSIILKNSSDKLEKNMKEFRDIIYRCVLSNWKLEEDYYSNKPISQQLMAIKSTNNNIKDIFVMFHKENRIINCEGLNETDFYLKKVLGLSDDDYRYIIGEAKNRPNFKITQTMNMRLDNANQKGVVILSSYPLFSNMVEGTVCIALDERDILNMAISDDEHLEKYEFYILDNRNNLIISSNREQLPEKDISILKEFANSKPEEKVKIKLQGKFVMLSLFKSSLVDWKYVVAVDYNQVAKVSSYIQRLTLVIVFALMLIGMLFAYFISKNLYRPIYKIMDIFGQGEKNDEQEFIDEFKVISEYICDMKQKNKKLMDNENENIRLIKEYYAQSLLLGVSLPDDMKNLLSGNGELSYKRFYAVVIYFAYTDIMEKEYKQSYLETSRIIGDVLGTVNEICWLLTSIAQDRISVIINCDTDDILENAINTLFSEINKYNVKRDYKISIGIGNSVENISRIRVSYEQAETALKYRIPDSRLQILFAKNLGNTYLNDIYIYYPVADEKKLVYDLLQGDYEGVRKTIEHLALKNKLDISSTIKKIEYFNTQILNTARKSILLSNLKDEEKFSLLMKFNENREFNEYDKMMNWVLYCYKTVSEAILKTKSNNKNEMIHSIIQYVDENYYKDISLDILSEHFGFNPKYISAYFKNNTGMNYIDYLNTVRIENAIHLIKGNRNLKISDIAQQVGFVSTNTFISTFRKYEGMTPGKYKETI